MTPSLRKLSKFDWILIGFIIHSLGSVFLNSSKTICYILSGVGLGLIFFNATVGVRYKKPFTGWVQVFFMLYLCWSFLILVRPFIDGSPFSKDGFSLINRLTALAYLTPLVVYLGFSTISLNSIFKLSYAQAIIGVLLLALNYNSIFSADQSFDSDDYQTYIAVISTPLQFLSACSFMILCFHFIPRRYRLVSFATIGLSLYTVLISARRSNVFMYLLVVCFVLIMYILGSRKKTRVWKVGLILTVVTAIAIVFTLYADSLFSFFISRLDEDTRGIVEIGFFDSFRNHPLDWIVGRGINGTYIAYMGDSPFRGEIETGYLHLILKGGIIYLSFFVFFLLHSAWMGLFRSNNLLTKAMAFNLIAHVVFLIPFGLPAFDFEYVTVWVCVLFCQSLPFRKMNNSEVLAYLKTNKILARQ